MEAKHTPVKTGAPRVGGERKVYRFKNGYGASVIRTPFSYGGESGLWELAVIKFIGDDIDSFDLVYDTPITSDVVGHLSEEDVSALLDKIAALQKAPA